MVLRFKLFASFALAVAFTLAGACFWGCGNDGAPPGDGSAPQSSDLRIRPGEGIGEIPLKVTYGEVAEILGEPGNVMGYEHQIIAPFPDYGVELVLASSDPFGLADDAVVLAVGTLRDGAYDGPVAPGAPRSEVEAVLGRPRDGFGSFAFYEIGMAVEYDATDAVRRIAVYEAYTIREEPPEMEPAASPATEATR